jgi:hypothetical protein
MDAERLGARAPIATAVQETADAPPEVADGERWGGEVAAVEQVPLPEVHDQ